MRTHYCGGLRATDIDQTVTLFGWVDRRRDHGGVIFIDLRDRTGLAQIVSDPERTPESYNMAEDLRNEYVVKIVGRVSKRPDESLTPSCLRGKWKFMPRALSCSIACANNCPFRCQWRITKVCGKSCVSNIAIWTCVGSG